MKNHDENKDVRLVGRIAKIDTRAKTITMSKNTTVGIRVLGRIDFLCNHCGYVRLFDNSVAISKKKVADDDETKNRPKKSKEHQLTNKNKRGSNKSK